MRKIILVLGIALLMIISATAFRYNQIEKPVTYSTSKETAINISGGINVSAFPYLNLPVNKIFRNVTDHVINVTILNKSSSSGAYGILASSLSLTVNASNYSGNTNKFWNFTATLKEGRNWIRLNFTNVSRADDGSFGGSLTNEVIVDIDTNLYMLSVGQFKKINLSLDGGNITIAGNYQSNKNNMTFVTVGGTKVFCGVDNSKVWSCS